MKFSWIFVVLLLVLVAVFSVQNAAPITVHFLRWQITMSAALVIQLAALLGGLVGLAFGAMSRRASRATRDHSPSPSETAPAVKPAAALQLEPVDPVIDSPAAKDNRFPP